ncbi:MAG: hypothetical protein EBR82_27910 [Caulobacteraceae bacterium]|nr:hypothetical protein [Caulobacteraceae bacterium]
MKVQIVPFLNEVYSVEITDHPLSKNGVAKRVGYCGLAGSGSPIAQHGLQDHELRQVTAAIKAWQDEQATQAEVTTDAK